MWMWQCTQFTSILFVWSCAWHASLTSGCGVVARVRFPSKWLDLGSKQANALVQAGHGEAAARVWYSMLPHVPVSKNAAGKKPKKGPSSHAEVWRAIVAAGGYPTQTVEHDADVRLCETLLAHPEEKINDTEVDECRQRLVKRYAALAMVNGSPPGIPASTQQTRRLIEAVQRSHHGDDLGTEAALAFLLHAWEGSFGLLPNWFVCHPLCK